MHFGFYIKLTNSQSQTHHLTHRLSDRRIVVKVVSLHVVELLYMKAITISQITSDKLTHHHHFSSARYLPTWWKSNYSIHGPPLRSNFLGTTPTCKTMGPSYAIQVYGATYGQLFLLSRDFFVQKFKKKKKKFT